MFSLKIDKENRIECGNTSHFMVLNFSGGVIGLYLTASMVENWTTNQLYIDELVEGMQQKLLVMLHEGKDRTKNWAKSQCEHLTSKVPRYVPRESRDYNTVEVDPNAIQERKGKAPTSKLQGSQQNRRAASNVPRDIFGSNLMEVDHDETQGRGGKAPADELKGSPNKRPASNVLRDNYTKHFVKRDHRATKVGQKICVAPLAFMARQPSDVDDYSGFYSDDLDPDPELINDLDEMQNVSSKVTRPVKKTKQTKPVSESMERLSDDDIVDSRNGAKKTL